MCNHNSSGQCEVISLREFLIAGEWLLVAVIAVVFLPLLLLFAAVSAGSSGQLGVAALLGRLSVLASIPFDLCSTFLARSRGKTTTAILVGGFARSVVSSSLKEMGDTKGAMKYDQDTLSSAISRGAKHAEAAAKITLARDYMDLANFKEAESLLDDALSHLSASYNELSHTDALRANMIACDLSLAYMAKGRYYDLLRNYRQSESMRRIGANYIDDVNQNTTTNVIPQWCGLADTFAKQRRFSEADGIMTQIKERISLCKGKIDPMCRIAVTVVAFRIERLRGNLDLALEHWKELEPVLKSYANLPGFAGELESEHAILLAMQEKYKEADASFARAIGLLEKRYCPTNPELLETIDCYAAMLEKSGNAAKSEKMRERAADIRLAYGIENA